MIIIKCESGLRLVEHSSHEVQRTLLEEHLPQRDRWQTDQQLCVCPLL